MSFPRYPEYKESGVAWLGEVPAHWTVLPIKAFTSFSGGGTPSRDNLAYWGGRIPWVSPKDMKSERIAAAEESITEAGLTNSAAGLVLPGQVLMVVRSGILKHTIPVAIAEVSVALNQDMKALRFAAERCLPDFFLRWVQGLNDRLLLAWSKQGATVESIEHGYLANSMMVLPSLEEQRSICAFLDHETAKIDALVAEQQRLIELLQEKRQAVISHAVTKGLNPDAPLKESGVEWLGEVPTHWKVGKIGFYTKILSGFAFPSSGFSDDSSHSRLLRGINVGVSSLKWEDTVYWSREANDGLDAYVLKAGDLVIGMDRPLISEGMRVAIVREEDTPCLLLQRVALLRTSDALSTRFLQLLLSSPMFVAHFAPETTGVSVPQISPEQIRDFIAAIPPRVEQDEIVAYVDRMCSYFDSLIDVAESNSALLLERRAAIITAAVTGQIDVRYLAAAEAA